jgi:lysophospholipase L1-like esterase
VEGEPFAAPHFDVDAFREKQLLGSERMLRPSLLPAAGVKMFLLRHFPMKVVAISFAITLAVLGAASNALGEQASNPAIPLSAVPRGGVIVFTGDSITAQGESEGGWVRTVREKVARDMERGDLRILNAARGGFTVPDLLATMERPPGPRPAIIFVCIGINDALRADPSAIDQSRERYRADLERLLRQFKATGARVVAAGPILAGEEPRGSNFADATVDAYNEASRAAAGAAGVRFLDLRAVFFDRLSRGDAVPLTTDGVHLSAAGNNLMASAVLRELARVDDAEPGGKVSSDP